MGGLLAVQGEVLIQVDQVDQVDPTGACYWPAGWSDDAAAAVAVALDWRTPQSETQSAAVAGFLNPS